MSGLKNNNDSPLLKRVVIPVLIGTALLSASQVSQGISIGGINIDVGRLFGALTGFQSEQGDGVSSRILVSSAQSAVEPQQVGSSMQSSMKAAMAAAMAENQAHRILKVHEDMQIGKGISPAFQCVATAERTKAQSIIFGGQETAAKDSLVLAADYSNSEADKHADRTYVHLTKFCDVTEAAAGVCLPSVTGMAGKDTDYSIIHNSNVLSQEALEASYAYMRNVVDPTQVDIAGCETDICTAVSTTSKAYKGLSSMIHGAYLNQISDASRHDYGEIGTDTNAKLDADGNPVVVGNTPPKEDSKDSKDSKDKTGEVSPATDKSATPPPAEGDTKPPTKDAGKTTNQQQPSQTSQTAGAK